MPPKKKLVKTFTLQLPGGQATPAPPVGPSLGQHGVNIMEFVKAYNAQTEGQRGVANSDADDEAQQPDQGLAIVQEIAEIVLEALENRVVQALARCREEARQAIARRGLPRRPVIRGRRGVRITAHGVFVLMHIRNAL